MGSGRWSLRLWWVYQGKAWGLHLTAAGWIAVWSWIAPLYSTPSYWGLAPNCDQYPQGLLLQVYRDSHDPQFVIGHLAMECLDHLCFEGLWCEGGKNADHWLKLRCQCWGWCSLVGCCRGVRPHFPGESEAFEKFEHRRDKNARRKIPQGKSWPLPSCALQNQDQAWRWKRMASSFH